MRSFITLSSILLITLLLSFIVNRSELAPKTSGAPPYGEPESSEPMLNPYWWLKNWHRPEGPPRVGIQIGHYKHDQAPEEQIGLRDNSGASAGGVDEVDLNFTIATKLARLLEEEGILVNLLPTTIPPGYWADVFISIHADGNEDPRISGYKFAAPWKDFTGKADSLIRILESEYEPATGFAKDPDISNNMRGYYAFAWWRYQHAIHPMTTAVIAETGFVTNPQNRNFLVSQPEIPAQAIATAITKFLKTENLL